ncbi:MAG TPA: PEP-CTERM sorting domain-containing protein [Pirellulales bacterium]|nr:PEP-CTERM sorting domain-containing protein [Pirellulales bacterium]
MRMSLVGLLNRLAMHAAAAASLLVVATVAHGQTVTTSFTPISSFTPGDLVVMRTGDATNADSSSVTNQVPVYLDEYTPSGTYVGTVSIPSTGAGAFTLPGSGDNQHQGVLNLSTDGKWLAFAGYNSTVGSSDANIDASVGKLAGKISLTASSLDTSTVVNSYGAGSANPYIRGAFTTDGNQFWTFGKYSATGATSNGGLAYVSGTGPSATTTTVEGFADWRDVIAVNGQLYGGTGSSSVGNHGPYQISTGLPTTNLGNSLSNNTQLGNYPGGQSASALALLNVPGNPNTQNGLNVLYTIGDQSTAGITKYYFNGTSWVNQTNVPLAAGADNVSNPTGLIAVQDPTNPNWVDITVSGQNGIYTYVDKTGYNGAIPANSFTHIVGNSGFDQFRGVATVPTPEPSTFVLAGLGVLGAGIVKYRRRKA